MAKLPEIRTPAAGPSVRQPIHGRPVRPLGAPFSMETAFKKERRFFWQTCLWLVAGPLGLGLLFVAGEWMDLRSAGPLHRWASWLVFPFSVAGLTLLVASPFGFLVSLWQWLKAIWNRRKLVDFACHPGFAGAPPSQEIETRS